MKAGHEVVTLVSMLTRDGERLRFNGIPLELLRAQADALGTILITEATDWSDYDRAFAVAARRARATGAAGMVFGGVRGEAHRAWNLAHCEGASLTTLMSLWGQASARVIEALQRTRITARLTAVRADVLSREWLGHPVNALLVDALIRRVADPCGEDGEYHSLFIVAPAFRSPIAVRFGGVSVQSGYWQVTHCSSLAKTLIWPASASPAPAWNDRDVDRAGDNLTRATCRLAG